MNAPVDNAGAAAPVRGTLVGMATDGERQRIFLVRDAAAAGRSRRWIDRAELERPFRGVRALPVTSLEADPFERERADIVRAALSYAGILPSRAYFSHTTAAVLWDLPLPRLDDPRVHVSTPGRAPRSAGVVGHEVLPALVRVRQHPVHGVRVCDPASTWAMLGGMLDLYDLIAVGDAVVRVPRIAGPYGRVLRPALATPEVLRLAASAGRRTGARALRQALGRIRPGVASRPETYARLLLVDAGLPEPITDHDVFDRNGAFLGCVDLAYPELMIAIEYEGDQHRTDARQWQRDIEKHEQLADAGWRVIRVPRDQLFAMPDRYVDRVRVAIRARS